MLEDLQMALEARYKYLDIAESEDDNNGYISDAEPTKGRGRKPPMKKRTSVEDGSIADDDSYASSNEAGDSDVDDANPRPDHSLAAATRQSPKVVTADGDKRTGKRTTSDPNLDADPDFISGLPVSGSDSPDSKSKSSHPVKKKLTLDTPVSARPLHKNLVTTDAAIAKSGVLYLSRIPPFMKPTKLRSLLSPHGQINRIFLAPEDPTAHARRVRAGGNKKRTFVEGWVEFVRKRDAKLAAELLNTRPIGGKKGSYYRDDVWSMLYLRGFKWRDLTAQIATEEQERAARMRAEMGRAAREDKEFARNVERSRVVAGMEKKRRMRHGEAEEDEGVKGKNRVERDERDEEGERQGGLVSGGRSVKHNTNGSHLAAGEESDQTNKGRPGRAFRQTQVAKKRKLEKPTEQVTRVLSKIF